MRLSRLFTIVVLIAIPAVSVVSLAPVSHAEPQGVNLLVTRLDDPAPNGCNPGDCSLREAVLASNLNTGTDSISVTLPGTIELSIVGPNEELAATGDLDLIDDVFIAGQGAEITIVDANGLDRVFDYTPIVPGLTPSGVPGAINDMTITGGSVVSDIDAAGGGIRVGAQRDTGIFDVVVRSNSGSGGSFGFGGGVANNGGSLAIFDSAVVNNTADNAGGVANIDGTMRIVNSTISGNTPAGAVGGVINFANTDGVTATLIISDSTIAYNVEGTSAASGAGLDSTAFAGTALTTVSNSIIANNIGDSQCFFGGDGVGTITSAGYNLSADASCNFTVGTDLQDTDPLLGALVQADSTYYHSLSNGSPALDSGDAVFNSDQRGFIRPVDLAGIPNTADGSDRGAIEMAAEPPTAVALARLAVMSDNGFMRGAAVALALAALGMVIALRRK